MGIGQSPTRRLFLAVWPDEALVDRLRSLERPERPGLRWTTESQWHVTLRFLGSVDAVGEAALVAALDAVAEQRRKTTGASIATAGPRPRIIGSGVWALPVRGLDELAADVREQAVGIGRAPERRPFLGHLTLARARERRALEGLEAQGLAATWSVEELTLVQSQLQATGARYDVVGSWCLTDHPPPAK